MTALPDLAFKFNTYSFDLIRSTAGVRTDLFNRQLNETLLTDFFGGVAQVELVSRQSSSLENTEDENIPPARESGRPAFTAAQDVTEAGWARTQARTNPPLGVDRTYDAGLWGASLVVGGLLMWSASR